MSLVISPSVYENMELFNTVSTIETFDHSQFSGNNLNNIFEDTLQPTFTTPLRRDLNSSAANTVSPMTLNTMTTVIDTLSPISTNSTSIPIVSPTDLTDIYNVVMGPSLVGTPIGVEMLSVYIQARALFIENLSSPVGVIDLLSEEDPIEELENLPIEELVDDHPIEGDNKRDRSVYVDILTEEEESKKPRLD
jgi:hypothetical protein